MILGFLLQNFRPSTSPSPALTAQGNLKQVKALQAGRRSRQRRPAIRALAGPPHTLPASIGNRQVRVHRRRVCDLPGIRRNVRAVDPPVPVRLGGRGPVGWPPRQPMPGDALGMVLVFCFSGWVACCGAGPGQSLTVTSIVGCRVGRVIGKSVSVAMTTERPWISSG
jgi:hypothetical protein